MSLSPVFCSSPAWFQEFENPEGEDCSGEYTPPAEETSSSQSLPDVYILPLAEVSLPMPAPQPSHSGTAPHPDQCARPNGSERLLSGVRELSPERQRWEPQVHGNSYREADRYHLGGSHWLIQNQTWGFMWSNGW